MGAIAGVKLVKVSWPVPLPAHARRRRRQPRDREARARNVARRALHLVPPPAIGRLPVERLRGGTPGQTLSSPSQPAIVVDMIQQNSALYIEVAMTQAQVARK